MGEADEILGAFLRSKPRPPSIGIGTSVQEAERLRAEYVRASAAFCDKLDALSRRFGISLGSVMPSNSSLSSDEGFVRAFGRSFEVRDK